MAVSAPSMHIYPCYLASLVARAKLREIPKVHAIFSNPLTIANVTIRFIVGEVEFLTFIHPWI